ncbi:phosphate/phosphite/phosphonate ABC transporter substrate-binding protein [Aeromicrobium chenweiae]|uniref:Phosphate/phosphite/phosphonate ABC transporter substrate-binding protein n=1 Tax=Aeromicrobium chenweiae TaxID=2079793 RepID=A0A2S0WP91_9ACTN|nr:phosphate/phosphite/phosphonate ABC transporter substrate-binding protein [Aeromicrobium chenweiae]AWB93064.1 phosphate/phosphite/phosphonate ABC transporter substrate-binding protein [Aeromicrobium chenweiae]TGN34052.1 phosphate/phosphite/phosphonate ABC transporter substrate-binding protein [Aeromicrobium chenweiae]
MTISRTRSAITGALALTAALTLAACGGSSTASSADDATCPHGKIRFGVEPFEDPAKLTPAFKVVGEALSEKLDCPVEITVVDSYAAEVLAMKNGKLDLGVFGPLGYVFASQEAGAEPVASFGTSDGKLSTYNGGIWVKKGSPITSIDDLKGQSLALSEPGSTSGDALPRQALADAGIKESDLDITYAGGHPEALLALTHGKVDAAEINSQQLATSTSEGQFDEADYTQIWQSDPIPNDPITVAGSASPEFKKAVKDALLDLPAAAVAKAGSLLDVDPAGPLLAVDKSTYQPLFDLAETLGLTTDDL